MDAQAAAPVCRPGRAGGDAARCCDSKLHTQGQQHVACTQLAACVCYSTCSACSSDMLCRWLSSAFTQGHQQSLADWDHDHQGAPIECLAICQSGAWAKTGVVASGSCNGVVLLTSLADGALLSVRSENRHDEAVTALAFNHDGSFLVSCSRSHVMYLWAVAGASSRPECLKFLHEFWNPQDTSVVTACTLCPDTESSWKHLAISGSQVG